MKKVDFLAIGDITTDAFIKLKDYEINCSVNHQDKMVCMRFGDKIPFEEATVVPAVGNSPNAAVSAHRLELASGILTWIGDDKFGEEDVEQLNKEGLTTDYVQTQAGMKTNYHYVLRYGPERTILVQQQEYDYVLPDFPEPQYIYLSSLAKNSLPFHLEIANYVKTHPNVKLAFQPGTFQINLGYDNLKEIYEQTDLFFCNKEEAQKILETEESDMKKLLSMFREKGPKTILITDGPNGAYAHDGKKYFFTPMYPDPADPVDRTGAGDSFASTVTSAIINGEDLPTALSWGPINSMSVVQHVGAQAGLLPKGKLLEYLKNAPEEYRVKEI